MKVVVRIIKARYNLDSIIKAFNILSWKGE